MSKSTETTIYNAIRSVVLGAVYLVPVVGSIARGVVSALWPEYKNKTDVWDSIKARVDEVVITKISAEVYSRVTAQLEGINNVLVAYYNDPGKNNYESMMQIIRSEIPTFQEKGYETQLLPLLTQLVNIYLLLLKEGIQHSDTLKLTTQERDALQQELATNITELSAYANKWYEAGIPDNQKTPTDLRWEWQNKYKREYALGVLYYLPYWQLLDPSKTPQPNTNPLETPIQIFSNAYGNGGRYFTQQVIDATDLQAKKGKITHITIYGRKDFETWIQGAQVTYGTTKASTVGSGVSAEIYGSAASEYFDDNNGRVRTSGSITVSELNPITEVWGYTKSIDKIDVLDGRGNQEVYDIIYGIGFTFKDGTKTPLMGMKGGTLFTVSYPGHILSNISAMGVSNQKLRNGGKGYAMGRVVFGFRRADSYPVTTYPLYSLYKRTSLGDAYDFANNQSDYDAKVGAGWTGQGIVARIVDSLGDVGLFVARNQSNTDVVRLFVGRGAYDAFNEPGWSMDGPLGYLLEDQKTHFGPTLPFYLLTAGTPQRTMIEFNQQLFEAQQTVGWRSESSEVQRYALTLA